MTHEKQKRNCDNMQNYLRPWHVIHTPCGDARSGGVFCTLLCVLLYALHNAYCTAECPEKKLKQKARQQMDSGNVRELHEKIIFSGSSTCLRFKKNKIKKRVTNL